MKFFRKVALFLGAGTVVLAIAATAFAFPTNSTVYPSFSGCTTNLTALASYQSGEKVTVLHEDFYECATTVGAQARILILGVGVVMTGWTDDSYLAITSLTAGDFYYGYGWGAIKVGSSWSAEEGTLSVHP